MRRDYERGAGLVEYAPLMLIMLVTMMCLLTVVFSVPFVRVCIGGGAFLGAGLVGLLGYAFLQDRQYAPPKNKGGLRRSH